MDLSVTMQALLGLAILVCRMIVLRYTDAPEEQEKGFTGNTILLAQPTPERMLDVLPPAEADVGRSISVCFNSQHVTRAHAGAQKALAVDPDLYVRCARLRQDRGHVEWGGSPKEGLRGRSGGEPSSRLAFSFSRGRPGRFSPDPTSALTPPLRPPVSAAGASCAVAKCSKAEVE